MARARDGARSDANVADGTSDTFLDKASFGKRRSPCKAVPLGLARRPSACRTLLTLPPPPSLLQVPACRDPPLLPTWWRPGFSKVCPPRGPERRTPHLLRSPAERHPERARWVGFSRRTARCHLHSCCFCGATQGVHLSIKHYCYLFFCSTFGFSILT